MIVYEILISKITRDMGQGKIEDWATQQRPTSNVKPKPSKKNATAMSDKRGNLVDGLSEKTTATR